MRDILPPSIQPRLVLIRGLPGTGKTTLAQGYVAKGYRHFEVDHFFMRNGQYSFDKERLSEAHAWCLAKARATLERGEFACVADVFAGVDDIKPYTQLGVSYEVVEATRVGRSVHNVHAATLAAMRRRWVPTQQLHQALLQDEHRKPNAASASERLPDLIFPDLTYGKQETPWDLRRFLYKGGAGTNLRIVGEKMDAGELGRALVERVELVRQMHDVLANALGRGVRRTTLKSNIQCLVIFFTWADETGTKLDIESVERSYLLWTDALLQRVRVGTGLGEITAYDYGSQVGWVLDRVLGRDRPIIRTTRLRKPKERGSRAVSPKTDKQNLEETFAFGHFLLDIADGLNREAIWGPLPVTIPLRNGQVLDEWSGLKSLSNLKPPNPKYPRQNKYYEKRFAKVRAQWEADLTFRTRYPLVNLRIQAEMFMLMGQPGVNLAQVYQLRMDQWKFKPSTHGFEVRTYKHRRWGPVVFEIYSEYRKVFERYLEWRAAIFPDDPDGLLFPLIREGRLEETPPSFNMLKSRCKAAGIKYLPPSVLRNTNVNWMLRRTGDPELTAAEKQHSIKTLLGVYEKPSQQRAMVQAKLHWAKADPALAAAGPGSCDGKEPEPIPDIPPTATRPDCATPAGCLFCVNQRDIDSLDHFWSLATYRLLKIYELAAYRQPESKKDIPKHPAELAIDRLTAKLAYIKASNSKRKAWIEEALLCVEEGNYHPDWAAMIEDGQAGRRHET